MSAAIANRQDLSKAADCCGTSGKPQSQSMQTSVVTKEHDITNTVSFSVEGMTCMSCVNRIETALIKLPGVSRVFVDLSARSATIGFDPDMLRTEQLKSAIDALGYTATESKADVENSTNNLYDRAQIRKVGPYPFFIGIVAALGVIGFYFGLLTLTSDWANARMQFDEFRWWIIALSLGLGTQVTLFSFMKKKLFDRNIKAAKSGLAASGGMSTASMAACCTHYLVPLVPALGLPFLSAAVAGIATYQTEIFMLGVLSNLFGLGIMLRVMHKNGILKLEILHSR